MRADRSGLLSGIKFTVAILTACMMGGMTMAQERSDIAFDRTDLDFVLKQIVISERHAAGEELINILPNTNLPWGMRTVDGRYNNLQPGQEGFGQADLEFPESAMRDFRDASDLTFDPDGPGGQAVGEKTSYNSATNVEDSTPRLISHLIVNQSTDNPAAVHAAAEEEGENIGPDITGVDQFFIGNVATDEGLSAPSNTLLTFFGQFFDHGLDLINKGGNGNVFMRVPADDPLFDDTAGSMNMMIMPRASRDPGPDGVRGTADDVPKFINATTPHVDQQQTYASHSSSQILLRHYAVMGAGSGAADVENIGAWMDGDVPGYNHAAPAGSNRVLVVMAHAEDNGSTADMTDFTSVTYGGQALTQVVQQRQHQTGGGGFSAVAEIWILDEAGLQAAANSNIVATTTGGNGANEAKRISSLFFSGVDQADPTGQTGTDGENDNNTQTLSVTVTGGELDDGDMVIANNTVRNDQNGDVSFAWANGFVPTGEYSPSPNSVGAFLTYSDAQTLADGAETATVQIMNNGVGALSVVVLNHATGSAGATLQNTGLLLEGYGPDETLDTADDGGMATWDTAQAQGRLKLGLDLDDMDGNNVPMIYSDEYGNFIPGSDRGLPQLVTSLDPLTLVEGNLAANGGDGVDATMALRVNHSFFLDVAHSANPNGKIPDTDSALNPRTDMLSGQVTRGIRADGIPDMGQATYDDELLGRHFICGDGRCNENIALTTIHSIFHREHNRLQAQVKRIALDSGDVDFLNEWLDTDVAAIPAAWAGLPFHRSNATLANQEATRTAVDALDLDWNGQRLFQAARFGTEMQYNRVVFDEFVPTLSGLKDPFSGFHVNIDPSITTEFSQSVYRFGHSMLTETVERLDANHAPIPTPAVAGMVDPNKQLGLFEAFLNPLAWRNSDLNGVPQLSPEEAAGSVLRGLMRAQMNEIDEFVTGSMQNNVVGLPLDLGAINIARGRDVGNPRLNDARRAFYNASGDHRVLPYQDWIDYLDNVRHELSGINFIAAYGTHPSLAGADGIIGTGDAGEPTTYAARRAAACGIVSGLIADPVAQAGYCTGHGFAAVTPAVPADALDFLLSRNAWANDASGRGNTGMEDIDFWVGGLAEERMPFGGLLGSTHNFVFEVQAEALELADRFYYVGRTKGTGMNFFSELESNPFTALLKRNSDMDLGATNPLGAFFTQNHYLEVDQSRQYNAGYGSFNGGMDNADPEPESELFALIIRDAEFVTTNIPIPDPTRVVQYTGGDHVTIVGTSGRDTMIGGIGDDSIWGSAGDDVIEGGDGADHLEGGPGNDIITDLAGPDVIEGGDGDDAISSGNEGDVVFGDAGNDFLVNSSEEGEVFAGEGDDFMLDGIHNSKYRAGLGDDWIEDLGGGENIHAGDQNKAAESGEPTHRGNDVFVARGGNNDMDMEHGDDIMVDGPGQERMEGQLGFDWAVFQNDPFGVSVDLDLTAFLRPILPISNNTVGNRYDRVEGLSGSPMADILRGTPNRPGLDLGSELILRAGTGFELIEGLNNTATSMGLVPLTERRELVPDIQTGEPQFGWTGGEIIIGGADSDILVGEAGDDILDGDSALHVGIDSPNPAALNGPEAMALVMAEAALADAQTAQANVQAAAAAAGPQAAADAAAAAPLSAQAAADQANADDAADAAAFAIAQATAAQSASATASAQAAADAAAVATAEAQSIVDEALALAATAQATADAAASGAAATAAATAQASAATAAAADIAAAAAAIQAAIDATTAQAAAITALIEFILGTLDGESFSDVLMAATDAAMASGAADAAAAAATAASNTAATAASAASALATVAAATAAQSEAAATAAAATAAASEAAATAAVATAANSAAAAATAAAAVAPAQAAATMAAQLAAMVQATADASAAAAAGLEAAAQASAALLQALTDALPGAAQAVTDAAQAVAIAQANKDALAPNIVVDGMLDLVSAVFAGLISPSDLSISRIISDHDEMDVATDSALFSGEFADYDIEPEGSGFLVVTDTRPLLLNLRPNRVGNDGRDLVRNVERLVFSDGTQVLAAGTAGAGNSMNAVAAGRPTITGAAAVGQTLVASIDGVTDADNIASGGDVTTLVSWEWQAEVEAGSNFFAPLVRLAGTGANGDPLGVVGDELLLTVAEAGSQVRVQGIFKDEEGVFEIVTSLPETVSVPAGFVLPAGEVEDLVPAVANFIGTGAFVNPATVAFSNLALSGGNPQQGFGVSIARMDLILFENTGFSVPIGARDEAAVSNILLTFTNDASGEVTGTFTPEISASIRSFPLRVEPGKVNLNFEILGDAISGLVNGPTTASVSLDGVELSNATFDGDSSVDFGRGVLVTLVNGEPNPALLGDLLPSMCQGCSTAGEGDTPENDEDGVDIPTDTVASTGTVDRRGRIRIRGFCDTGRAAAPGLTCETHANGDFDCKGRGLDRGDQIDAVCTDDGTTAGANPGVTLSGIADSRGSVRVSGVCEGFTEASASGLRCSTRRSGSFRCSGRDFAPGEVVEVSCN